MVVTMARASPEVLIAPAEQLAAEFARRAAERARAAVRERGVFTLAIPGGSIARAFLPALDAALPWECTDLFWVDERAVPDDDPESNAGMAKALLATGRVRARGWHPIGIGPDLDACARAYGDRLVERLGVRPVIDLILLGLGEDGHVASLFPGRATPSVWVAGVPDAPKPPSRRVTLTLATLVAARRICIAALGEGKARIITEVLEGGTSELPAARVLAGTHGAWVLLDPGAASQLRDSEC